MKLLKLFVFLLLQANIIIENVQTSGGEGHKQRNRGENKTNEEEKRGEEKRDLFVEAIR